MAVGLEVNTGSRQEKPLKQRAGWCQYTESSLQVAFYNSWDFGGYSWCTLGVNCKPASTLTELYIFVAQAAWSSMKMGRHYITYHSRHPGWYLYFPGYPGQYLYFPGCRPRCAKWIAKVTPLFKDCLLPNSAILLVCDITDQSIRPSGDINWPHQIYPVTQEEASVNLYID